MEKRTIGFASVIATLDKAIDTIKSLLFPDELITCLSIDELPDASMQIQFLDYSPPVVDAFPDPQEKEVKIEFRFGVQNEILDSHLWDHVVNQDFQDDPYITGVIGAKDGFNLTDDWACVIDNGKIVFVFPIYRNPTGRLCIIHNGVSKFFDETHYELLASICGSFMTLLDLFPSRYDSVSWYMESLHAFITDGEGWANYQKRYETIYP